VAEVAVLAGRALIDGELTGPVTLSVADGRIASVDPPRTSGVIDASGATVLPGLLDVHTHGGDGVQLIDGADADLERLAMFYARHGVTGFLASVGGSRASFLGSIAAVRAYLDASPQRGARCLGLHLEGPFISAQAPGAFQPQSILPPDTDLFREILDVAGGYLRRLTIAPEAPGADAVIDLALHHGVTCSAGHSVATGAQVMRAVDAGVRSVTHLFNAMAPFHHREPGLVGVALADQRLVCELIADGVHVHPTAVRLAARAKGVAGIALISDSIAAAGLPDGEYELEEQHVTVADGESRLADGTLAGSTLTLDRAVANLARWADIPLDDAVRSATEVPARLLGLDAERGTIAVGRDADLAAFGPDQRLLWTMVGGELYPTSAT
jgi:N-acetylglucosamine-6-phosphate deacetylase